MRFLVCGWRWFKQLRYDWGVEARLHPAGLKPQRRGIDKGLLFVVLGLVVFGVVMVFNASVAEARGFFGDEYFFAKRQIVWAFFGFLGLFVFSKIDYKIYERVSLPLFLATVILLALVFVPGLGQSALGASRWIVFREVVVQPSELAKLTLIIYLAAVLKKKNSFVRFAIPVVIVLTLVVLQPDLGTGVNIALIGSVVYFISGAPILWFLGIIPLGVITVLVLALTSTYRRERIMTFINPDIDPLGSSYHVRQILIALGSGGLWGLGLGQSRQKYFFLPKPATDSIFAVIGEELGFVGGVMVIAAFLFLVARGFSISRRVSDPFGRMVAGGITFWIAIGSFVNLGAMVGVLPLTGVPLPFISYGGSSLIVLLVSVGILLNISKHGVTSS